MQAVIEGFRLVLPEAMIIVAACGILSAVPFFDSEDQTRRVSARRIFGSISLIVLLLAWFVSARQSTTQTVDLANSFFRHDNLAWFVQTIGFSAGILLLLLSWNQIPDERAAEIHACLLLNVAGVNMAAAANDLVSMFLALELLSIPTYVFLYLPKRTSSSQEAATKYFLLSIFSSAMLLYGFSFLFGVCGSTNLEVIRAAIAGAPAGPMPAVLIIGLLMATAGLGYKITAAPFHFYAPDVFNGAPLPGAALLAFLPKAAGFVVLLRLVPETLLAPAVGERTWSLVGSTTFLFGALALLTMFVGNFLGLLQDNVKRMLAYSSVAHTGYMLVGLAAGPAPSSGISGTEAILFYLAVYGSMTLGVFAVLAALDRPGKPITTIGDLAGLSQTHPMLALMAAVCLFSLTGLPPTAGFWGKLYLFFAAWSQGSLWLRVIAILLALNAAIGAWYYLRIVGSMYLNAPKEPSRTYADRPAGLAVVFCSIIVLALFVAPSFVWNWTEQAQAVVASR